jgi:hypothetical protein
MDLSEISGSHGGEDINRGRLRCEPSGLANKDAELVHSKDTRAYLL